MNKMKRCILISCIFLIYANGNAQETNEFKRHKIFLKTNPLSIFEPDGGLNIGVDLLGKSRWCFSGDINFVFFSIFQNRNNNDNLSSNSQNNSPLGFRLKPELRHYFLKNGKDVRRGYFAFEGLLTRLDNKVFKTINVFDNIGNLLYLKRTSYNEIKTVVGLSLKTGYRFYLNKNEDKHIIEMYVGFGIRQKFFKDKNVEFGTITNSNSGRDIFDVNTNRALYPSMPLGIKYVMAIK